MKQVPLINTRLKLNLKGKKFKKKAKDTAGYTAVIAAIAQGIDGRHVGDEEPRAGEAVARFLRRRCATTPER